MKQETRVHDIIINVFKIESFTAITCSYKFKSEDWPKKLVHLGEFCFLCPLGGIHYWSNSSKMNREMAYWCTYVSSSLFLQIYIFLNETQPSLGKTVVILMYHVPTNLLGICTCVYLSRTPISGNTYVTCSNTFWSIPRVSNCWRIFFYFFLKNWIFVTCLPPLGGSSNAFLVEMKLLWVDIDQ